jgi:hypothetical protein
MSERSGTLQDYLSCCHLLKMKKEKITREILLFCYFPMFHFYRGRDQKQNKKKERESGSEKWL